MLRARWLRPPGGTVQGGSVSLRVNNNVEAFNAHRNLTSTQTLMSKSMEKLSSGLRINRAGDDAAGLAISEKMRSQIRGLAQAQRNSLDGVSLVQTAEGSLNEMHNILQRVRELSVQRANGTLSTSDQAKIDAEVGQLTAELTRINTNTKFNGIDVLAAGTITLQVGANSGETIAITNTALTFTGIASTDLASIDTAIGNVSDKRATLGALQNRLESTISNLGVFEENLQASESRIRDVDVAQEMVRFTKLQILSQSGTAMLAQANQAPQGVMQLLRG